eukprot:GHVT01037484.1.p1 GENE.GHVT01037484.1~~GHVT01037484.1.p1  ORF type:complete len:137 (+),score=12.83 GHVT01037484.1:1795-2205(+)
MNSDIAAQEEAEASPQQTDLKEIYHKVLNDQNSYDKVVFSRNSAGERKPRNSKQEPDEDRNLRKVRPRKKSRSVTSVEHSDRQALETFEKLPKTGQPKIVHTHQTKGRKIYPKPRAETTFSSSRCLTWISRGETTT